MSDLQCPATIILARHGEAVYETDRWYDDGGTLTVLGRSQARALGERYAGRRVAHTYASTMARAVQTAELAAAVLGVAVTTRNALQEFTVGDFEGADRTTDPFAPIYAQWLAGDLQARVPGGESGLEVVTRLRTVLGDIADLHRGETVLVVSHGGILRLGIPAMARIAPGVVAAQLGNTATAVVDLDADGAVCTAWDRSA
ncbi:histidine phosphatase family protein [Calidifontibacter sp. DB0510]|uniref:Histidine phosphatase family protein n=1 Tax=Metallococcus carri TaxID=1656884 RepID=A0A967E907_9MICO|nr:histidine phosphatase family protein [Metallococcus carri]NHN54720.1 histidine phosphatase family protein [Metallococcus carri]NOP37065.1 histidine phosphatase family protein [Calidifontibacter sp. DB2511S]